MTQFNTLKLQCKMNFLLPLKICPGLHQEIALKLFRHFNVQQCSKSIVLSKYVIQAFCLQNNHWDSILSEEDNLKVNVAPSKVRYCSKFFCFSFCMQLNFNILLFWFQKGVSVNVYTYTLSALQQQFIQSHNF